MMNSMLECQCLDYHCLSSSQHVPIVAPCGAIVASLPRIDDLFNQLVESRMFSSLDLAQGYHQI